jgi:ATP-dependent protease HslVU (ClpYQ) peptidase subunit
MTIIAYRDGVMAADTCITDSAGFVTCGIKLHKKQGHIIGFCGDVSQALVFVDWFFNQKKNRKPDINAETGWEAMVLNKNGVTTWDRSLRPIPMDDSFYAIGSGAGLAIGAMERDATAEEAVVVACKRNPYCRLPVTILTL